MKEDFKNMEDEVMEARLWDYIDGAIDASEQSAIAKLIEENAAWRIKYAELLEVHQLIDLSELEEPSMRFTKNVMDEIARTQIAPATKNYINKKVIWGIAAFFITVIVGSLIYAIAQVDWSVGSDRNMTGIDFTQVDYSKMFSNTYTNIFIMLNIIFGLFLLDRYLADKRKKFLEEA
jgi:hypothetical protein